MKRLLNLGVSDPLTLGMTHPMADRLETLGRARPMTWRSRYLALSAMSAIAISTAPLSIAADAPEKEIEVKVVTNGQSYEIVDEDGGKKAYRILKGEERKEVDLTKKSDGTYQLTYDDGQVVELPNFDERIADASERVARASDAVAELDKIQGHVSFKMKEGIDMVEAIENLKGLKISMDVRNLEGLEFSGKRVVVIEDDGEDGYKFLENPDFLNQKKEFKIIRKGDAENWVIDRETGIDGFQLEDSVVESRVVEIFESSDPIETARHQLERAKRQLENLSDNESVSFDLQNALRDIESAQKSLEEAERRLSEQDE